ncbi:Gfo/Idh/MocA family oxidoreductase [bacterium]|nr:Gfo/Idh/MocA family oxidoreductase [bacterium]
MTAKIRAVLVGCGGISAAWLRAVSGMEDLELAGLVDLREDLARKRADEFSLRDVLTGTDLSAMLDALRPDLVFDCTIPEAHQEVACTALGRGCHVLGEKPLADTMDHARRMVQAASDSGRIHAVMQNRRYDPNIQRLRDFLDSRAIGPITTVNSDFYIGAHFGGFRDHMAHVLLLDMAIHTFDAARFLSRTNPESVFCKEWNPRGSWYDRDASAVAVFQMCGGVVYTYRGSWCAEGLNTTWESEWRIVGEKGAITWDGANGFRAQCVEETDGFRSKLRDLEVPVIAPPGLSGHAACIREFVDCVRSGTAPQTICTDNIKSLAMVFGAVESSTKNELVTIHPGG